MGITITETLNQRTPYVFTDPDCFLHCDNPACTAPWLGRDGLVVWQLVENQPCSSRFSERVIAACNSDCLEAALQEKGRTRRWSAPMPIADWLEALRASLDLDPQTTPIGEFAGAAYSAPTDGVRAPIIRNPK